MIGGFYDQGTEDVLQSLDSPEARRILPIARHQIAARKLAMLNAARFVDDLGVPPGNRLEKLKGTLNGYVSIRINDQWRIIFRWSDNAAQDVRICDY